MTTNAPTTWPEKLREAAEWFDTIDRLLAVITIEDNATGEIRRLVDQIGTGTEIQDDLRHLANLLETETLHEAL